MPLPWGLYVHIPFCPYKCDYCDFVAVGPGARTARWHQPYLRALRAEARYWSGVLHPGAAPRSAFYGGGTPTLLPAADLAALHAELAARFGLPVEAEVTVEANPGTIDAAGLAALRRCGINRLSLGLQASQDRLLRLLGRHHGWEDFRQAYAGARATGWDNVSVDLMYGLPGQSLADCLESAARVLELGPEHISAYALQVEAGTPFFARAERGDLPLPDQDAVAEQFAGLRRLCAEAGLEPYEVSNFARPGRACRHNLLYWENADYLGLGIGAHSHWQGARWANTTRLAVYRDGVVQGEAVWVGERQQPDAARERSESAFLGLRLLAGIDLEAFAQRHGLTLEEAFPGVAADLVARGLCRLAGGRLALRPEAVLLGNRAFVAFV